MKCKGAVRKWVRVRLLSSGFMLLALAVSLPGAAAEAVLTISTGKTTQVYTAITLLRRTDATSLTVEDDVSYGRTVSYRAVPLGSLVDWKGAEHLDTLEARAIDGFVAQIPLALFSHGAEGGAVAWLAVEDPGHPWPTLPHMATSAGPFYLVWKHPERSGVRVEQWPFGLVSLSLTESPVRRWPQLQLPPERVADTEARSGQQVFLALCLPCHRLNEGGNALVGPDLGQPMNVTRYLTDDGLRALIRNPRAVRTWPGQHMAGFSEKALPPEDLEALVAYLHAVAAP